MDFKLTDLSLSIIENIRLNYYSHHQLFVQTISNYFSEPLFKEKITLTISNNKAFLILNTGRHAED
jgi:hypothetical protein